MLRFFTSGESHGQAGLAFVEGLPAGLRIDLAAINAELRRRQSGYGRGNRQKIESDEAKILSGVRHGITTGAPITLLIDNRDFANWTHVMSVEPVDSENKEVNEQLEKKSIKHFRPGHADLAGTIKFHQKDIRDVLERSSARETAARVAAGALCQQLLQHFDVQSTVHVLQIGNMKIRKKAHSMALKEIEQCVSQSDLLCLDIEVTEEIKQSITKAWQDGDTLGGVVEVIVEGLPVGLGSYTQWDLKLDGKLAQAIMSVQAVKAVEIGDGFESAGNLGSQVHDAIYPSESGSALPFKRNTNHAGGLEGGMTNGERLIVRGYMKPISTLREGLDSLSFPEFTEHKAHYERSDVCAVPACAIVCKAMVNIILAEALLDKFGGDSIVDLEHAVKQYRDYCRTLPKKNAAT